MYYRLRYIRYANDYLLAVEGPKWLAKGIQKRTQDFLKSNLLFQWKKRNLVHYKHNKVSFLGFEIKVPSRKDKKETQKIFSFKKIKNSLTTQKHAMKSYFEKSILNTYEITKLKALKALLKGKKAKVLQKNAINALALNDAYELIGGTKLKVNK